MASRRWLSRGAVWNCLWMRRTVDLGVKVSTMTKLACAPRYPHPPRVGRCLTGQSIRMSDLLIGG